jgi:hypothetical protein
VVVTAVRTMGPPRARAAVEPLAAALLAAVDAAALELAGGVGVAVVGGGGVGVGVVGVGVGDAVVGVGVGVGVGGAVV